MSGFRGGVAFDLVDVGWFQAPGDGFDRSPNRVDANLPCRGQIRNYVDTILTFLSLTSGSSSLHVGARKHKNPHCLQCPFEAPGWVATRGLLLYVMQ